MSRANSSTQSQSGGLMPLEAGQSDAPAAGVFRLEAMAPGVATADSLVAPRKRKVSTQALALGALLAFGGGMIYAMRLLGIGPMTTLAHTELPNYDLAHSGSRTSDNKQILQDLAANHAASQVPVEEVQKNPFKMSDLAAAAPAATPGDNSAAARAAAERAKRDADQKRSKVLAAFNGLKINGIIGGSHPVARISGDAVRVGDTVAEVFTVKAIKGRSVELEHEGEIFELSMDEESANSNKPSHKK
jgi:hypothetical protein